MSPAPPTAAELGETIKAILADWIAAGRVQNVTEVGNGHCYDFAEEVMTRLGWKEYGWGYLPEDSHGRLIDVATEDWWNRKRKPDGSDAGEAESFTIDIARLRREGAPLPQWIEDDDIEIAQFLGSMTHSWLVLDGRHYDATCPDGAAHFFEMPFFANQIARLPNPADQTIEQALIKE